MKRVLTDKYEKEMTYYNIIFGIICFLPFMYLFIYLFWITGKDVQPKPKFNFMISFYLYMRTHTYIPKYIFINKMLQSG